MRRTRTAHSSPVCLSPVFPQRNRDHADRGSRSNDPGRKTPELRAHHSSQDLQVGLLVPPPPLVSRRRSGAQPMKAPPSVSAAQLHGRVGAGQAGLDGGAAGRHRRNAVGLRGGREDLVQPLQQGVCRLPGGQPGLGLHQPVRGHLQELRRYGSRGSRTKARAGWLRSEPGLWMSW